jgi:hypothetical protein
LTVFGLTTKILEKVTPRTVFSTDFREGGGSELVRYGS